MRCSHVVEHFSFKDVEFLEREGRPRRHARFGIKKWVTQSSTQAVLDNHGAQNSYSEDTCDRYKQKHDHDIEGPLGRVNGAVHSS
jgi:hypothetical protein